MAQLCVKRGEREKASYTPYRQTSSLLLLIIDVTWLDFKCAHPKGSVLTSVAATVTSELSI